MLKLKVDQAFRSLLTDQIMSIPPRERNMSPSTFDIAETTKKRNLIIKKSKDLGFDVIGFANPKLPKSVKKNLDSFLNSNFHGEMDWLAKNNTEGLPKIYGQMLKP